MLNACILELMELELWEQVEYLGKEFKRRMKGKVCLVKTMVFSVVIYGCERWTIKKAEHRRIDVFQL